MYMLESDCGSYHRVCAHCVESFPASFIIWSNRVIGVFLLTKYIFGEFVKRGIRSSGLEDMQGRKRCNKHVIF